MILARKARVTLAFLLGRLVTVWLLMVLRLRTLIADEVSSASCTAPYWLTVIIAAYTVLGLTEYNTVPEQPAYLTIGLPYFLSRH